MHKEIEERYSDRSRVLKALAHPTRLFIVDKLSQGEQSVQNLTDMVGDDISTVSRHLSVLKNARMVKTRKEGLKVFYSLTVPCILDFFGCIENVLESDTGTCSCSRKHTDLQNTSFA